MKLLHWPLMGELLHSEEETRRAAAPPSPLLAVPNVTAHQPTTSVPIIVLLYDDPLLCGFIMAIKGLTLHSSNARRTKVIHKQHTTLTKIPSHSEPALAYVRIS